MPINISPSPGSYFVDTRLLNKKLSNYREERRVVFGNSRRDTTLLFTNKLSLNPNTGPGSYNTASELINHQMIMILLEYNLSTM